MTRFRYTLVGIAIGLALSSFTAFAQQAPWLAVDPNGDLYVIANGQKNWIVPAPISDVDLAVIPPGVDLLDGVLNISAVGQAPQPPAASAPTPDAPATDAVSLSGTETKKTQPFGLQGGTYRAQWTATLKSSSCYFGAELRSPDSSEYEQIANTTLEERGTVKSDETVLYNIPGGIYYLDVDTTGCDWTITIVPL